MPSFIVLSILHMASRTFMEKTNNILFICYNSQVKDVRYFLGRRFIYGLFA